MNLAFQETIIKREPLEILVQYIDLDETKIKEYPERKLIVIEDITLNLKQAITYIFNQLDLFYKTEIVQIQISLADGSIKFLFKDKEKIYNSKLFGFDNTNKKIAIGLRTIGKIIINQIRKAKGLSELNLDDLFKAEIGVMNATEIKARRPNMTGSKIKETQQKAEKHIDNLIKEKSYLYKKEK